MSCGTSCPCQLKWPLDTQGSKRDPVNSEKAWLDFAVRLLSREVVGKGRGQETVWSERCKPQWWVDAVGLPWKNPTANPKDSKEVLLKKYTALEKRLREEGRFPAELEEEARLWNEGKYRELFLLTSLTSLLGKVTGVHSAIIDACTKTEELKAEVHQSLLNDIKHCLASTLRATENFKVKSKGQKVTKRPQLHSGDDNKVEPVSKCRRLDENSPPKPIFPSNPQPELPVITSDSLGQSKDILNYAQKLLAKKRQQDRRLRPAQKCQQKIQPKPPVVTSSILIPVALTADAAAAPGQVISVQPQVSPGSISLPQADLSHLLDSNNIIVCSQPGACSGGIGGLDIPSDSSTEPGSISMILDNVGPVPVSDSLICSIGSISNTTSCDSDLANHRHPLALDTNEQNPLTMNDAGTDFLLTPVEDTAQFINISPNISDITYDNGSLETQLVLVSDPKSVSESSAVPENISVPSTSNTRTSSGRTDSLGSGGHSEQSHEISDAGYCSEASFDLDKMFSADEQHQLWEEDGSFLLDRFLDDLENTSPGNDGFDILDSSTDFDLSV